MLGLTTGRSRWPVFTHITEMAQGSAKPLTSPAGSFVSLAEVPASSENSKCLFPGGVHSFSQVKAHSSSQCRCSSTLGYDSGQETFPRRGPSQKSQEEWPLCGRGGKSILSHFWWAAQSGGMRSSILPSDLSPHSSSDSCS